MNRLLSFGASSWVLLICLFMTGSAWSQQAPPSVTSVVLNGGDAQRSMIKSVALTFSDDVGASLQAADLNIVNASTNTAITGAVLSYDTVTRVGTWTFPAEVGKSLPDGIFSIFIRPADVTGSGGQLAANPGTTLWSDKFFRYFGDFDGDRDVDFLDTSKFRKTYTRTATTSPAEFNAAADADDNGIVDATDLALFQAHYLSVVPAELTPPTLINPPVRTSQRTVTLSGNSAPNSRVQITNGFFVYEGVAGADGNFAIVVGLLSDRINYLLVSGDGLTSQDPSKLVPVTITQDSTPPFLYIDYPSEGARLASDKVTVTGRVGDTLSGFTGMAVNVNGVTATITAGIGPNGTYEARNVPLVLGENFIFVTASDILGTSVSRGITINRIAQSQIEIVSGDDQSAVRNTELPQPIIVRVKDSNGLPFSDKIVNFKIKRSDGRVNAIQGATLLEETVTAQARTNAQGLAQVFWRLGSDAGKSNNLLCAVSAGIPGQVFFRASALCRPATQINVGMGNNQVGEAGATAALPLTAWVSDDLNGCENVPVTFTVISGDATVNGGATFTRNTDSSGHVDAILKFGRTGGPVTVEATHAGNQGVPAVFNLRALVRAPGSPTVFKAVVQDNTGQPIGGATCTLNVNGVRFPSVNSADDGTFTITGVTPGSGFVQVDGRTATTLDGQFFDQVGRFPSLVYRVNIVPNAENALPVTVYLPTLNPVNERTYNGTQDVELTIEGIAGLKMRIKAGSMTLSNGTKPNLANPVTVSLNQVHSDNIPMPIQDGVAPLLTWTLQPSSAKFSPPVEIEYPNMTGLAPGSATNFLSYNHDIERFEIVASATVSADGSIIKSDPGTGLTSSGWGCNCPPYSATGECEDCKVIVSGPVEACVGDEATYRVSANGGNVGSPVWAASGGAQIVREQGSTVTVVFTRQGNASIGAAVQCGNGTDSGFADVKVFAGARIESILMADEDSPSRASDSLLELVGSSDAFLIATKTDPKKPWAPGYPQWTLKGKTIKKEQFSERFGAPLLSDVPLFPGSPTEYSIIVIGNPDDGAHRGTIKAYPSGSRAATYDFGKFGDEVSRKLKAVPFFGSELNSSIQKPNGVLNLSNSWAEQKNSPRVIYAFEVESGLDPVFGVNGRVTVLGIPAPIRGKIGGAGIDVVFGGSLKLLGRVYRDGENPNGAGSALLSGTIRGGLETVGTLPADIVSATISATTSITASGGIIYSSARRQVYIEPKVRWDGFKFAIKLAFFDGLFEFTDEWNTEGEDLYKAEPIVIISHN